MKEDIVSPSLPIKVVGTIKLVPTWRGLLRSLVMLATTADNQNSRDHAWAELERMADICDKFVELQNIERNTTPEHDNVGA